jgi:hypothetical protein
VIISRESWLVNEASATIDRSNRPYLNCAIARLLDLRILRYNFAVMDVGHQWAYYWTYDGKLVLKKNGNVGPHDPSAVRW